MAHTDKDLPDWVKALHSSSTRDYHYACANDTLGGVVRETHVEERVLAPHWHWRISLVRCLDGLPIERPNDASPVYDAALDRFYRQVERTVRDKQGGALTTTVWVPLANYEVIRMLRVSEWVFAPRVLRTLVVDREYVRECDIESVHSRGFRHLHCHRWLDSHHGGGYGVSKETRRTSYYRPERAHIRSTLRAAAAEYRANGRVDIEPLNRQSRHAPWAGGWWN